MSDFDVDLFVVGAGSGGVRAARIAAGHGAKVAVAEEYRTGGKVSMIRITGKSGITKTYIDTDGDGRLEGNPKDGPVAPVYYKLYEWN